MLRIRMYHVQKYDLRQRRHEFALTQEIGHLTDCNFITRLLYKDCY